MNVPLLDLKAQRESLREEIDAAIGGVLDGGTFILGPNVKDLEREVAEHLGIRHGIGVASGTDALLLTLRAFNVGPGDEVIVPAYTFFATCGTVLLLGARPVVVDIDPATYCMDVNEVERRITSRTKAIVPVHLFGHPADMDPILEMAGIRDIKVVEDNAQAIGAMYKGKFTGGMGDAGCLSFYPTKNLGAYGDGGMVVTNDDSLAAKLRVLRTHGWTRKYYPEIVGYNSRLDELQAAILRVKLSHLNEWNERRGELAHEYGGALADLPVHIPDEAKHVRHVYYLYVMEVDERERVIEQLGAAGIATAVYYPHPVHLTPAVESLGYEKGDFPVAERAAERCLAIPLYPEMTLEQVRYVAGVLKEIVLTKAQA